MPPLRFLRLATYRFRGPMSSTVIPVALSANTSMPPDYQPHPPPLNQKALHYLRPLSALYNVAPYPNDLSTGCAYQLRADTFAVIASYIVAYFILLFCMLL